MWSLATRLDPGEAAATGQKVMDAMYQTTDPTDLSPLARALAALAPTLGQAEATADARRTLEVMTRTTDADALQSLTEAVGALSARLETDEAYAAARQAAGAVSKNMESGTLAALADALQLLLVRLDPERAGPQTAAVAGAVGSMGIIPMPFTGMPQLHEASRSLSGRFTEQQLVDLLKMPTCGRQTRQVIVRQLGWQCGQTFGNEWDFVECARQQRPDIDLISPPVRPDQP